MPLVDHIWTGKAEAEDLQYLEFELEMLADLDTSFDLSGSFLLGINTTCVLDSEFGQTICTMGIDYDSSTFLKVDADDPNVELEATFEMGFAIEDFVVNQTIELQGIFQLGMSDFAQSNNDQLGSNFFRNEGSEFLLSVDVTPIPIFTSNYQEYKARLLVNGGGIPIRDFTISAAPNKIGLDVSVVLARKADRALLINAQNTYVFELGVVDHAADDAIRWETMCTGQAGSDNLTLGWENNAPTDTVQLTTSDIITNNIHLSPELTTVFFDRSVLDLRQEDFEPILGIGGLPYPVILLAGYSSLYAILGYCFNQIGLSYSTNIPNFRVTRLDIEIGQSYFQGVSGLFGAFEPVLVERDNVIHILDSTSLSIGGFPTNKTITIKDYKTLSLARTFTDINGYVIRYTQNQAAWDYFDEEDTETQNAVIDEDEARTTYFYTSTTVRSFRKRSFPSAVVRTEVTRIVTETWVSDPTGTHLINSTVEVFTYDPLGKQLRREKTESARVPIFYPGVTSGHWEYNFGTVKYERDLSIYKPNPYKRGTEYRSEFNQITRAFIYIDPDKQFETNDITDPLDIEPDREVPTDYKQEYVTAYRSGNLKEPDTDEFGEIIPNTYFGAMFSRLEKIIPLSEDLSRVETKEVDYLNNITIVNVSQEQVGEISTNSQVPSSRRAIVIAGNGNRNNKRLETFNIGEIPIGVGIGLALRKLAKNDRPGQISIEYIGFDLSIKRGTILNATERNLASLGSFFIQGWRIEGRNMGTTEQTVLSYYDGEQV